MLDTKIGAKDLRYLSSDQMLTTDKNWQSNQAERLSC
jgi:hypothetical protein